MATAQMAQPPPPLPPSDPPLPPDDDVAPHYAYAPPRAQYEPHAYGAQPYPAQPAYPVHSTYPPGGPAYHHPGTAPYCPTHLSAYHQRPQHAWPPAPTHQYAPQYGYAGHPQPYLHPPVAAHHASQPYHPAQAGPYGSVAPQAQSAGSQPTAVPSSSLHGRSDGVSFQLQPPPSLPAPAHAGSALTREAALGARRGFSAAPPAPLQPPARPVPSAATRPTGVLAIHVTWLAK